MQLSTKCEILVDVTNCRAISGIFKKTRYKYVFAFSRSSIVFNYNITRNRNRHSDQQILR